MDSQYKEFTILLFQIPFKSMTKYLGKYKWIVIIQKYI